MTSLYIPGGDVPVDVSAAGGRGWLEPPAFPPALCPRCGHPLVMGFESPDQGRTTLAFWECAAGQSARLNAPSRLTGQRPGCDYRRTAPAAREDGK